MAVGRGVAAPLSAYAVAPHRPRPFLEEGKSKTLCDVLASVCETM